MIPLKPHCGAISLFPYASGGLHFGRIKFIAISPTEYLRIRWRKATVGKILYLYFLLCGLMICMYVVKTDLSYSWNELLNESCQPLVCPSANDEIR